MCLSEPMLEPGRLGKQRRQSSPIKALAGQYHVGPSWQGQPHLLQDVTFRAKTL